jgi:hypothetical protein
LVRVKLATRFVVSVSMFSTPSIFSKSLRTEAAQPPQVMFGTLSFTSTTFVAAGAFAPATAFFVGVFAGALEAVVPPHPIAARATSPGKHAYFLDNIKILQK